jgi:hypothetical protein
MHMKTTWRVMKNNGTDMQNDKLNRLVEVLGRLMNDEFTGHIKINFTQGGIGRIEKFEEILRGK